MSKKTQQVIPPAELVEKAQGLDTEARRLWGELDGHVVAAEIINVSFGKVLSEMRDLELHRYVRKGTSRKGYPSFPEWVQSVTKGKLSKSSLYMAMGLHKLTEGPNAIPAEEVAQMDKANAYRLSGLTPEQRTPELIEDAKKTGKKDFPKRVQEHLNASLPLGKQLTIRVDFFRQWHPDVKNKLEQTIEDFTLLPIVRDWTHKDEHGNLIPDALTLQEKALLAICFAAQRDCYDILELLKKKKKSHEEEIELPEALQALKPNGVETKPAEEGLGPIYEYEPGFEREETDSTEVEEGAAGD